MAFLLLACTLYTSDAADEEDSVNLCLSRIMYITTSVLHAKSHRLFPIHILLLFPHTNTYTDINLNQSQNTTTENKNCT